MTPLTPEQLAELRRLWEQSTQGYWFTGCKEFIETEETVVAHMCGQDVLARGVNAASLRSDQPDQHWIATAHNHFEALLAAAENERRLRKRVERLEMALKAVAAGIWRDKERNAKGLAGGSLVVELVESALKEPTNAH